ncbi:MAG: EAL domain-containing protein [Burkholderiaceae bacterium]
MPRNHEARLRLALASADMAVWDSEIRDGKVDDGRVFWSDRGAALIGIGNRACVASYRDFLSRLHPEDRERVLRTMQRAFETGFSEYRLEYRVVLADGALRWVAASGRAMSDDGTGRGACTLGLIWDVTPRKWLEYQLQRQKELAEVTLGAIGDGVIATDAYGVVRYMNRVAEHLTGWPAGMAAGMRIEQVMPLVDEATGQALEHIALKCLQRGEALGASSHCLLLSRQGRRIPIEDSAAPIRAVDGSLLGAVMVLHDVSHERQLKHRLSWQASHDALTGLLNRTEFESRVGDALAVAKHDGGCHALLYIDLDQFKVVNDTCGHHAGDELLRQLSTLLQSHIRDSDILARLGGDELGVLLRNCPLAKALEAAEGLRAAVRDFRFVWQERAFSIGASIGMVIIDEDSKPLNELLSNADMACYAAKEEGRNRVHLYREADTTMLKRRGEMLWVARIGQAFDDGRFTLFCQPIVAIGEAAPRHAEVLVRIAGETGELILPGAFIPAAERFDLMPSIDRWVIAATLEALKRRLPPAGPDAGGGMVYAINLSGVSLNDASLADFIAARLEETGVPPDCLCFEITETVAIGNLGKAKAFMDEMRRMGCRFSLDDFGTGVSSFSYLRSLPVDFLKIDGSFIRDIVRDPVSREIVAAINRVGHAMGVRTVAEYVENDRLLEAAREIGIDYAQGYAVGGPQRLQ